MKIFYDHLIVLDTLERRVRNRFETAEEREEIWQQIDEVIHHRVVGCILDHLPREHHEEFLDVFLDAPYSSDNLAFLADRVSVNIEEEIIREMMRLEAEILRDIFGEE